MINNDNNTYYFQDGNSMFDSEQQMNDIAQDIAKIASDRILADLRM